MVVYACHCLNVRIFAEKSSEAVKTDVLETCPFGPSSEVVELIDQGFQFRHKCLVHRMRREDWTVYICVPCHMFTHAVNHDARLVVVNTDMVKGEEAIRAMKSRPDFSPVFNLMLDPDERKQTDDASIQLQSYETLQRQLGELQDTLVKYMKHEEEAMERKIRNYEEEQRNKFAKLIEKAQKDKTKLISILFNHSDGGRSVESPGGPIRGHAPLQQSKSCVDSRRDIPNFAAKRNENRRIRDSSPDVFAMDELENELEEDEENDTTQERSATGTQSEDLNNSNVQRYGRLHATELETADENDNAPLMSTSVPISVPAHARNLRNMTYADDDFEESAEFADIPRNMQALSESIQERDRYIFGDRPRQRVHTGDFTQVQWH